MTKLGHLTDEERIMEENAKLNMLDMCRCTTVPKDSQELLTLTDEEALRTWRILFMAWCKDKSLLPLVKGIVGVQNITLLRELCLFQQTNQDCFVRTADLNQAINMVPHSKVAKKRIAALCESGIISIVEARRDGNVYELAPLFSKIREIQERVLAANDSIPLFPQEVKQLGGLQL